MGQEATPVATPTPAAPTPAAPEILKTNAPAGGVKAEAPKAEELETYIVDGKTVKLTKAQAKAAVQKGLFADQKLKSLDVLQGKTAALINQLKTPDGLMQVLKDPALGLSPKDVFKKLMASDVIDDELKETLSKWVYDNVVVQGKKTPEQLAHEKQAAELAQYKKAEADQKAKAESEAQQAQVTQIYQAVRAEVTKQILADKTFPQTEGSIRAVVEKLRIMNKQGAPINVETVTKALELVKKDHVLHQQTLLDSIEDPEKLIELIGEARALKISKALVARLQAKAKAKIPEEKPNQGLGRDKVTDRIDKKLGRTPQGYHVLDV